MLSEQAIQIIKENQVKAIEARQLTPELLTLTYDRNWFRIWVPEDLGGLGMELLEGCQLLEDIAYYDGAYAWTVTLCSGATMFAGFIDSSLATKVFTDPQVCFGGSGQATGKAERVGENYLITGKWQYATGAPHLTHFTANCVLYEEGKALLDEDGQALIKSFFIDRSDVLIHYDWDTFGLACTASHSFSVESLLVDQNRSFQLSPHYKTIDNTLYNYPFRPFAEVTLLVNYMGMFRRFMDLLQKYLFGKSKTSKWSIEKVNTYFKLHDELEQIFNKKRKRIYALVDASFQRLAEKLEGNEKDYAEISTLSREIVKVILHATITLFPICGIEGAQNHSEINRVFRNIFTASQHSLLTSRD